MLFFLWLQLNLKDNTVSVDIHAPGTGKVGEAGTHDAESNDVTGDEDVNGLVDATNPVYNISVPDLTAHQNKSAGPNISTRISNRSVVANGRGPENNNVSESARPKAPLATTDSSLGELPAFPNGNNEVLLRKHDQRGAANSVVSSAKLQPDFNDSDVSVSR